MSNYETLATALAVEFPADAARVLEGFAASEVAAFLSELDPAASAGVLAALSPSVAADVADAMRVELAAELLARLQPRAAAALLRRAGAAADPILAAMPKEAATTLRRLVLYPANTAGAIMDSGVAAMASDVDVATALAAFRKRGDRLQHYLYVTDRAGHLSGVARPVDLTLAGPDTTLAEIAARDVTRLRDKDDVVTLATHAGWNEWRALPVVDRDGVFLGEVRHREIRRLLSEQSGHRPTTSFSLPISLAELFWLGLTGFTDGLANVVTKPEKTDGH